MKRGRDKLARQKETLRILANKIDLTESESDRLLWIIFIHHLWRFWLYAA